MMPELPEVEAVRSSLAPLLWGQRIVGVTLYHSAVIAPLSADAFCGALKNKVICGVDRRGKYLLVALQGKETTDTLMVHLRMTGQLICEDGDAPLKKHTHVVISLENGSELRFTDVRRFGKMAIFPKGDISACRGLAALGPEPLSEEFSPQYFYDKLNPKKMKIKAALLDQEIVAGLGNIYGDEALFAAGILPERCSCDLSFREVTVLCEKIKEIIAEAILHKGTSFRDYVDGEGKKGGHQEFLKVYQRENQPCFVCGEPICRVKIAGRSSHFCSRCQK